MARKTIYVDSTEHPETTNTAVGKMNDNFQELYNNIPSIGENGHWYIGETDTGIAAQGPPGNSLSIGQNNNWYINGQDTGVKAEGTDGDDGLTPHIGQNGNWYIGETDTGVKAEGTDGDDGLTPHIGQNGNWYIGETDTGVKAEGTDGESPIIGNNGNWYVGETDTGVKAEGTDGESPIIGNNGNWYVGETDTGVKAEGTKGDDGVTPHIGQNGNWYIGETDTGVSATPANQEQADWNQSDQNSVDFIKNKPTIPDVSTKADLVNGTVPSNQLPSYVDDVEEYAAIGNFPQSGESGKIYVAIDTNKTYRWSGSVYTEISPSPGSTDVVTEGNSNKYFTEARVLASLLANYAAAQSRTAVASTDSILQAFGKVGKYLADLTAIAFASFGTGSGDVAQGNDARFLSTTGSASFDATPSGYSGTPTQANYYKQLGNSKFYYVEINITGTGSGTALTVTLPFTAARSVVLFGQRADNGTTAQGIIVTRANSTTVDAYTTGGNGVWTNNTTRTIKVCGIIESA